jgi:hypothetical protein
MWFLGHSGGELRAEILESHFQATVTKKYVPKDFASTDLPAGLIQ